MAAALFRVTVERSSPMQATERIGIRYTSRLAETRPSAWLAGIGVPDRLVSGLKPETAQPATIATMPLSTIAAIAYVTAASVLPAKIWPRPSERVRIVLSVPL